MVSFIYFFSINTKCRKTRFPIPLHLHPFCNPPSQEAKDFINTPILISKGFSIADAVNLKTHKVYSVIIIFFFFTFLIYFFFLLPTWIILNFICYASYLPLLAGLKRSPTHGLTGSGRLLLQGKGCLASPTLPASHLPESPCLWHLYQPISAS